MKRRRVKITGIGFVTPAGIGKEAFWQGILEPVSRVSHLTRMPLEAGVFSGAEVRDFKLGRYVSGVNSKRMARHTQFAIAAAQLAVTDAGYSFSSLRDRDVLVMVGATLMDFGAINKGIDLAIHCGPFAAVPTSVTSSMVSGIGEALSAVIGGRTRAMSFQSACCSGIDSIGRAAEMISLGEADIAICGGTEAPLLLHPMLELRMLGLAPGNPENSDRQCRPFDTWRTTGVLGEGACIVVLEAGEGDTSPYAYVEGASFASDAPGKLCSGMFSAMQIACGNAGLRPHQIECVSAWGPGHKELDAAEASAMAEFFGAHLSELLAVSLKGAIGNPLGAAGAIQVGCAALGLQAGIIPPTVNWEYPDPACPLNLSSSARYIDHRNVLINAHGLSGTNACLILGR